MNAPLKSKTKLTLAGKLVHLVAMSLDDLTDAELMELQSKVSAAISGRFRDR